MNAKLEEWGPDSPNGDMAPILERSIERAEKIFLTGLYPLRVTDRCDNCPAEAQVRVYRAPKMVLEFCGHHFTKNANSLSDKGWTVTESKMSV